MLGGTMSKKVVHPVIVLAVLFIGGTILEAQLRSGSSIDYVYSAGNKSKGLTVRANEGPDFLDWGTRWWLTIEGEEKSKYRLIFDGETLDLDLAAVSEKQIRDGKVWLFYNHDATNILPQNGKFAHKLPLQIVLKRKDGDQAELFLVRRVVE
jgi:hypothetical protein